MRAVLAFSIFAIGVVTTTTLMATPVHAACTNPGSFNGANGSQYEYQSAQNTYELCLVTAGTPTPTPTVTPTSTSTPTATPTPTLAATPAAIATLTGCNPYDNSVNGYRTCVIDDVGARASAHIAWWSALVPFSVLIVGVFLYRR
jgi:hypothetical protein